MLDWARSSRFAPGAPPMPQFERRLYEPSDDMRAFDASGDDFEEEGSRLPLLIVIALVVLASFGGVVWLAYTQGVQRGRDTTPRVIAAQPPNKATLAEKNPYAGLNIYKPAKPEDEQIDRNATPAPSTHVPPKTITLPSRTPTASNGTTPVSKPAAPIVKPGPTSVANTRKQAPLKSSVTTGKKNAPAAKPAA